MKAALIAMLLPIAQPAFQPPETPCVTEIKSIMFGAMTRGPYQRETRQAFPNGELNIVDTQAIPGKAVKQMTFTRGGDIGVQIVIGEQGWHMFNGEWSELVPEVTENLLAGATGGYVAASLEGITGATCYGVTTHDGRAVLGYQFTVENEYGTRTDVILVADPKTKLPIEQTSIPQLEGPVAIITDTYTYDETITIEPPEL